MLTRNPHSLSCRYCLRRRIQKRFFAIQIWKKLKLKNAKNIFIGIKSTIFFSCLCRLISFRKLHLKETLEYRIFDFEFTNFRQRIRDKRRTFTKVTNAAVIKWQSQAKKGSRLKIWWAYTSEKYILELKSNIIRALRGGWRLKYIYFKRKQIKVLWHTATDLVRD